MKALLTVPVHRVFRGSLCGWLLAAALAAPAAAADRQTPSGHRKPVVADVRLIEGRADTFEPTAAVANLDLGLVAGSTRWDHDGDGISWNDTYVGFLWDAGRPIEVFAIGERLYFNDNIQFVHEVSPGRTVVGADYFRRLGRALPFLWTEEHGFRFLPTQCSRTPKPSQSCGGTATGVSANGRRVVGTVQRSPAEPAQAALWSVRRGAGRRIALRRLPAPAAWSRARDVSADGKVIVGDSGPEEAQPSASLWQKGGGYRSLEVGQTSSAVFVAEDGSAVIGWGSVDGRRLLVRWDRQRRPTVEVPPGNLSVESIQAVNPSATAVVGALSEDGNWAPFVWTLERGFVVIGELGREGDYDRSVARDVSDDGTAVVGVLESSSIIEGEPRSYAFLWTAESGLHTINDLVSRAGLADPDYFLASAISGNGLQILASGNPPRAQRDTNSILVTLAGARAGGSGG